MALKIKKLRQKFLVMKSPAFLYPCSLWRTQPQHDKAIMLDFKISCFSTEDLLTPVIMLNKSKSLFMVSQSSWYFLQFSFCMLCRSKWYRSIRTSSVKGQYDIRGSSTGLILRRHKVWSPTTFLTVPFKFLPSPF